MGGRADRGNIGDMPLWKPLMGSGAIVAVIGLILIPLPGPGVVVAGSGVMMILFGLVLRIFDRRTEREAREMVRRRDTP